MIHTTSDIITVGQTVFMDQYISSTPGRLPHTKGKESTAMHYMGGRLFVYHCSKFILIYNKVSLRTGETLTGRHAFESTFGPLRSRYQIIMVIMASLPLKLSKMIVM